MRLAKRPEKAGKTIVATVEAIRGGGAAGQISAKIANAFDQSKALQKTCAPVDLAAVRAADAAGKRARPGRERRAELEHFRLFAGPVCRRVPHPSRKQLKL